MATAMAADLPRLYAGMAVPGAYSPEARDAGRRALRLAALTYLSRLDHGDAARKLHAGADNMTEEVGALAILLGLGQGAAEARAFYAKWQNDRLVIDKWFALQITEAAPDATAETARALMAHKDFDWKNPNRFRAVVGALAMNAAGFHDPSGASYRLLADALLQLDPLNPQTAAWLSGAFETWRRYDADRQGLIRAELTRILAAPNLSRDLTEMVTRMQKG
jgi:aminopeptidase N